MTSKTKTGAASINGGYALAIFALILFGALIGLIHLFPIEKRLALIEEGGPVESVTIVGYAVCVFLMIRHLPWPIFRARWYFAVLCVLFAARELDFDKSLFTVGLLKSRQYIGDLVSLSEKGLSLLIVLGLGFVVWSICRHEWRGFLKGIIALRPSQLAVLAAVLMVAATKLLDGIKRKLAPYDINISESMNRFAFVFEEIGELGIPVFFAVAILTSRAARSAS